jgi:hypothetical protein
MQLTGRSQKERPFFALESYCSRRPPMPNLVLLRHLAAATTLAALLSGCATYETPPKGPRGWGADAYAVPSNYRQLVARKLAAIDNPSGYKDAKISIPSRPTIFGYSKAKYFVCTSATPKSRWVEESAWKFFFENGQISTVYSPSRAEGCRGLEWQPFPEYMRLAH